MSDISQFLGIDKEDITWEDLALCKGMDLNFFFDDYEIDENKAKAVDEHCLACPVIKQCGEFAQVHKEEGVWGGIYWTPGGRIDRSRNKHKTDKVWAELEKAYGKKLR